MKVASMAEEAGCYGTACHEVMRLTQQWQCLWGSLEYDHGKAKDETIVLTAYEARMRRERDEPGSSRTPAGFSGDDLFLFSILLIIGIHSLLCLLYRDFPIQLIKKTLWLFATVRSVNDTHFKSSHPWTLDVQNQSRLERA
ncbi:unnamed protein product [Strongylus vulgaris]|uniref:Uncharacterized protein n=1 Tax=Strongylus vulgaris TaxID=40348 RepID=A0A3P7JQE2_STRVU|nr:unnamed protein product [Strongylus vulgaris]